MLDLATVNLSLGALTGFAYRPVAADEPGLLRANDNLACSISIRDDYLRLQTPVFYLDELETEDVRSETAEEVDFYQEEIGQLSHFLEANRYGGASRGMSFCLDAESGAVLLSCKALCAALTPNGLQQLVHSLFMLALKQRVELFPDEVDPELARLCADDKPQLAPDLERFSAFLDGNLV
ncbi:MAG: hypothetical protein OXE42_14490 [Gammaproteobacteria bacterium]|nr:hypothetical protein [Gammaproteobacteria bacterium]